METNQNIYSARLESIVSIENYQANRRVRNQDWYDVSTGQVRFVPLALIKLCCKYLDTVAPVRGSAEVHRAGLTPVVNRWLAGQSVAPATAEALVSRFIAQF